jgi:hypothetical protein
MGQTTDSRTQVEPTKSENLADKSEGVRVYQRPKRLSPRVLLAALLMLAVLAVFMWFVFVTFR